MSRPLAPVRLALGTLTVLPVRPPGTVDRRTASWAMMLAPGVGLLLAVPAGVLLWLLGWGPTAWPTLTGGLTGGPPGGLTGGPPGEPAGQGAGTASALLASVLVVALLAWLTRAIHLDGWADTADGLGSGRPREGALDVMRRGDVGPFGVVTLVLGLLAQVAALAELVAAGLGVPAVVVALVVSRLVLPLLCSRGMPSARPDGLGALVAGSVGRVQLLLAVVLALLVLAAPALVSLLPALQAGALDAGALAGPGAGLLPDLLRAAVVTLVALTAAALVVRRAVRRLGGVTGDVLGAAVETTFTTALVVLALVT